VVSGVLCGSLKRLRVYLEKSRLEVELGGRYLERAEIVAWRRRRSPHYCKPLRNNAEAYYEIDVSLRESEPRRWECYPATTGEDTAH
jgi:hypothetical protein